MVNCLKNYIYILIHHINSNIKMTDQNKADVNENYLIIQTYLSLTLDGVQLILVSLTLFYLTVKKRHKNISCFIMTQIGLLWLLSLFFSTRNVWLLANGIYSVTGDDVPKWIKAQEIVAVFLFWLQHWMYVSLYTRFCILAPLIVQKQTPEVKRKRRDYERMLMLLDVIFYLLLIGLAIGEIAYDIMHIVENAFWTLNATVLAIALCLALHRMRKFSAENSKISDYSHELVTAHQISFVSAAAFQLTSFIITQIAKAVPNQE